MTHKLVVCDVDGTLLKKGETVINKYIIEEIRRLTGKGTLFSVASGRSYAELKKLFSDVEDLIYFVCLDGSVVFKNGEVVFNTPLIKENIRKVLNITDLGKNGSYVFYGSENNFYFGENEDFLSYLYNAFNGKVFKISSFDEISEDIFKFSICGENIPSMARTANYINTNRLFKNIYDDGLWRDYIGVYADKKEAVSYIQKINNIKYEETAVFGDNINDTGLLRCGISSYAVKGGNLNIKRIAKFETDDVLNELKKL